MEGDRPGLVVICGATATGKTRLAIALAQALNSVILSADSRLVYRGFDIGTAKPTITDRQGIPHYLIDICEPTETLTVADYQTQAQALIQAQHDRLRSTRSRTSPVAGAAIHPTRDSAIHPTNPTIDPATSQHPWLGCPILVGGTGLYIQAIVKGMKIPRVPPYPELRQQLAQLGQAHCYELLTQVDPVAVTKIHANDQNRTLRALEVFYVTGQPLTVQQGEAPPPYPIVQIGLACDREVLDRRIRQRTYQMVDQGLVEEVRSLGERYGFDLPLLDTLGYAEMKRYLVGDWSLDMAIEQTILHTRQFAKRQRTWFQKDRSIHWLNAEDPDGLQQAIKLLHPSQSINN